MRGCFRSHNCKWLIYLLLLLVAGSGWLVWWLTPHRSSLDTAVSDRGANQINHQVQLRPSPTPASIKIIFGGDMMFDRNIRLKAEQRAKDRRTTDELVDATVTADAVAANKRQSQTAGVPADYGFILQDLAALLAKQDLVVANLEGPVTDNQSLSTHTEPGSHYNYFFTFDPQILPVLVANNIRLVNLGNNHILNFGAEGYQQTLDYLKTADIRFFGQIGPEVDFQQLSSVFEKYGIKIGVVNFNQFGSQPTIERVLDEIRSMRPRVDWLVAYPHWGTEYATEPNAQIRSWAQQLIDTGADIVIGAHPHVVQIKEQYQGKWIYYSLGNFVFDQYFEPAVRNGLLLQVIFPDPESKGMEDSMEPDAGSLNVQPNLLQINEFPIEMLTTGETKLRTD